MGDVDGRQNTTIKHTTTTAHKQEQAEDRSQEGGQWCVGLIVGPENNGTPKSRPELESVWDDDSTHIRHSTKEVRDATRTC